MKFLFLIVLIISFSAFSQTLNTYIGPDGGNWSSSSNWDQDKIPDSGQDVLIWGNKTVVIDIINANCKTLQLGKPGNPRASGNGSISFSANCRLDVVDGVIVGQGNKSGSISLGDNGYLSASSFTIGNASSWDHGTGTIEIKGVLLPEIWMTSFYNLVINSISDAALQTDITINNNLTFISGNLLAADYSVFLASNAQLLNEGNNNYLIGRLTITKNIGNAASTFGNIGVEFSEPLNPSDNIGTVTIIRVSGIAGQINSNSGTGINRHWIISSTNPPVSERDILFSWVSADANGIGNPAIAYRGETLIGPWSEFGDELDASSGSYLASDVSSFGYWTIGNPNNPLPVELTSFSASTQKGVVLLNWKTATEVDNYGFEVERKVKDNWENIGFIEGHGNSNSVKSYTFSDQNVLPGKSYLYRLKQVDTDGDFEYSKTVEVTLEAPKQFILMQNHPNPFNPITTIVYSIPQAGNVSLKIYDVIGNQIAELVNEKQAEGSYEVDFNASSFPSGMYLYGLETAAFSAVKKMLLVK